MKHLLWFLSLLSGLVVVLIFLFLGYFSVPLVAEGGVRQLFGSVWNPPEAYGLLPMMLGSLLVATIATLLAFVYALAIALSLDRMRSSRARAAVVSFFALLSAIPTVVYGFLGVILLIPWMRGVMGGSGLSLLSAALVLSLVVTPTILLFLHESFDNVPVSYQSIVHALGGDRVDYQMRILLPHTIRGVSIGLIMGFGRAIGDTMIALMVAGNAVAMPSSLGESVRTLTAHIALLFAGDFDSVEFRSIFASGMLLFLFSLLMLALIRRMRHAHVG
jgi:phosphate transport system permease protein